MTAMKTSQPRTAAGTPVGGQFGRKTHTEDTITLTAVDGRWGTGPTRSAPGTDSIKAGGAIPMPRSVITLPRLGGSRDDARRFSATADLTSGVAHIDASTAVLGSAEFVDGMVETLLLKRRAESMTVYYASERLREHLLASTVRRGLTHQLTFLPKTNQ